MTALHSLCLRVASSLAMLGSVFILAPSNRAYAQYVPTPMYVDASQPNSPGDGITWATAWVSLNDAIANQLPGGSLYVRQGTYSPPNTPTGLTSGFVIAKNLFIYGGFIGTETSPAHRLGSFKRTILDGHGTFNGTYDCWHVVSIQGVAAVSGQPGVLIDGFTIKNGNGYATNGTNTNNVGGGIWSTCSDVDLTQCAVTANSADTGSGLYFSGGCSGPIGHPSPNTLHIKNSLFTSNSYSGTNGGMGGGIYAAIVQGEMVNTSILDNTSEYGGGGAAFVNLAYGEFDFTNCIFWSNQNFTTYSGGAGLLIDNGGTGQAGTARIVNCTFSDNVNSGSSNYTALAVGIGDQVSVYNSIFYYNYLYGSATPPIFGAATVSSSCIEGGWSGTGSYNVSTPPQFYDHVHGSLNLLTTGNPPSPCLDAADYTQLPPDRLDVNGNGNTTEIMPVDIINISRMTNLAGIPNNGIGYSGCPTCAGYLDMGAYEHP